MKKYTKRERLNMVLEGKLADRPPITAYRHFPMKERRPEDLAKTVLDWQEKYDWDIVKMHPAATYMQEVWGDEFDYDNYKEEIFPTKIKDGAKNQGDLSIFTKKTAEEPVLQDAIKTIKLIKDGLKEDVPILQTLFTPLMTISSVLNFPMVRRHFPADPKDNGIFDLFENRSDEVLEALENITDTYIDYWRAMREETNIDGIFLAGISWAREGYMEYSQWEKYVAYFDKKVAEAVKKDGGIVMYHTCGITSNPQRFEDFPIDILHWDQGAQNPSIKESQEFLGDITPMGGVDEMIFGTNAEDEIRRQTQVAVEENKDIPFILAPYCSISIHSTDAEVRAFRDNVNYLVKK